MFPHGDIFEYVRRKAKARAKIERKNNPLPKKVAYDNGVFKAVRLALVVCFVGFVFGYNYVQRNQWMWVLLSIINILSVWRITLLLLENKLEQEINDC